MCMYVPRLRKAVFLKRNESNYKQTPLQKVLRKHDKKKKKRREKAVTKKSLKKMVNHALHKTDKGEDL